MEVLSNVKDKKRLWELLNSKSCNGQAVCYTIDTINVVSNLQTRYNLALALAMMHRKAKVLQYLAASMTAILFDKA